MEREEQGQGTKNLSERTRGVNCFGTELKLTYLSNVLLASPPSILSPSSLRCELEPTTTFSVSLERSATRLYQLIADELSFQVSRGSTLLSLALSTSRELGTMLSGRTTVQP